jgi:site-specific recombinase XerD
VASEIQRYLAGHLLDTSTTLLLALEMHPRIVQERLGHADISITPGR